MTNISRHSTHSTVRRGSLIWVCVAAAGLAAAIAEADRPGSLDAPPSPAESLERMTVPDGFRVTLFAAEPDVRQPIAFTLDDRGRLWIAECYSYPNWMPGAVRNRDRILILEDADGDGRFDSKKVFFDRGDNFTGIALGFGGVWVCATPNLLFIPDRDRDDSPDGEPIIALDGWDPECKHNAFNALNWGPDGWLYGCNGILSKSLVGKPGSTEAQRVAINCGVWRYHPTMEIVEAVAHGTTNPWGLDFDDHGEMFITNCVIPHLFHVTPGAHFQRMFGQDINPYSFELMKSCADHLHWGGGDWTSSRGGKGIHHTTGGGHAHAGAMIYLGDNWPTRYRNSVFMSNIHGNRINHDRLRPAGSSYVATHERDFLLANDEWFRALELKYGPDGGVFLTDWSDVGECHDYDAAHGAHRESGRIYKITYGAVRQAAQDLTKLSDLELAGLQRHKNDWFVRQSRRLLQERAAAGGDLGAAHASLREMLQLATPQRLRAIWALYVSGGLDQPALTGLLDHEDEHVRRWAVRLLCEPPAHVPHDILAKFARMAAVDPSPRVRLTLASALGRIPLDERWPIAAALAAHADDAADPEIPLILWYALEPAAAHDRAKAVAAAADARLPLLRRFLTRRALLAADAAGESHAEPSSTLALTIRHLLQRHDPAAQLDLIDGTVEALRGRKNLTMPAAWPELYARLTEPQRTAEPHRSLRLRAHELALLLRDPSAIQTLTRAMSDPQVDPADREHALRALVDNGIDITHPLHQLLDDPSVRAVAIRGLAAYGHDATPALLLERFGSLAPSERDDAINTLASRPRYAVALLDAIEQGTVRRGDVSSFTARQLFSLGDATLNNRLQALWGTLRPSSHAKKELLATYKSRLGPEQIAQANLANGKALFARHCGGCHTLYGSGGDAGPDLTGSNRSEIDYILENVLDPSAVVPREYKLMTIATTTGRIVSGIVREQTGAHVVVQTANDRVVLARDDIEQMKESNVSMMPEGIFEQMSADDVRDLVGYLMSKSPGSR